MFLGRGYKYSLTDLVSTVFKTILIFLALNDAMIFVYQLIIQISNFLCYLRGFLQLDWWNAQHRQKKNETSAMLENTAKEKTETKMVVKKEESFAMFLKSIRPQIEMTMNANCYLLIATY